MSWSYIFRISFMKFHLLVNRLWLRTVKSLKFRQSKGNNSSISDDNLMKHHVHNYTMVIYIHDTFHEIPSIVFLVKAEADKNN